MRSAMHGATVGSRRGEGEPHLLSQPPTGPARLLHGIGTSSGPVSLEEHLHRWGPLPPWRGPAFVDELARSGLRGHGGGWFPVATKWRAVRRIGARRPVVVANGAEGEPASSKDRFLMKITPHLVLDGAVVAATSIGATKVVVHAVPSALEAMGAAAEERARRRLDRCTIEVVAAPERYLAGQESAVVNTVNGRREGIPSFVGLRSVRERGVDARPTLVQNVESLAHASMIARFGAEWFRQVGTEESPGTVLVTVTGRWAKPRIVEAPLGDRLVDILALDASATGAIQGVLLGGYGGGWIATSKALAMPFTEEAARAEGSSIGPGIVVLLPSEVCPLLEVSRVVRYMAGEGAGQCGPCVHGLAALGQTMERLAVQPTSLRGGLAAIPNLCGLIEGRGACRHPDGVARFARTALRVFEAHAALHIQRGPCHTSAPPFLFVPPSRPVVRR